MATATVDHRHHHLHFDSLPLIDLRHLSQSELLSLSHCSSRPTTATTTAQNDDDDDDEVSTPKIDRSVFNESAGSRKQTFSRFRLAPRNSSQIPPQFPPQFPSAAPPELLDEDNFQTISLLKSLLKIQSHSSYTLGNKGQLIPVQVHYRDFLNSTSNSDEKKGLHNVPVDVVTFSVKKRKRGRPRKDENRRSDSFWLIESGSKVNESKGESNKIDIPVNVIDCESIKRRPGRPRKNENRNINEYRVIESDSRVDESKGESNETKVAVTGVESLQNVPFNVVASGTGKRRRGRPRKDENRNGNEYRVIECESMVNQSKGGSNEIKVTVVDVESSQNIPVNVVASGTGKRRPGRPRKNENRNINEYMVTGSENLVNENKGESNENKLNAVSVESSQNIPVNVAACETIKRRRGRPRKDESRNQNEYKVIESENKVVQSLSKNKKEIIVGESKEKEKENEMVMENRNGVVVDLVALGNVKDPFAAELSRRTAGIQKEELFGYLNELKGDWVSRRQKRKIVDASEFGDALPRGWKLMLCIKKKVGHMWLACRRYISPNGQQFASCKEVSSYLLSLFGLQAASQSNAGHTDKDVQLDDKMTSGNAADLMPKDDKNGAGLVLCSSFACTPKSTEYENQATLLKTKSPGEFQRQETLNCHKCSMVFHEQDDLLHHLLTSHQMTTKRSRCSTSISEGVIIKDGKYECQLCHKLFEERHSYNGHLGGHMKNYVKRLGGVLTTHKNNEPVSVGVPSEFLERRETIGVDWRSFAEKSSNCGANNEINFGLPSGRSKADGIVGTDSDIHDEQIMMFNRNIQISVEENCKKQDRVSSLNNDKVDKVHTTTNVGAAKPEVCLGAGAVLSTNHSNKLFGFPSERDVPKSNIGSINNLGWQGQSPQNWSTALPGSDQPCFVDFSVRGVPISSMEEQRKERVSESSFFSSSGKGKIFSSENLEERHFTSNMEGGEIGRNKYVRDEAMSGSIYGLENAVTDVKEGGSFKGFSPIPIEQRRSESNMNGVSTSMLPEARQGRGIASVLPTSSGNKPTYVVNNYLNSSSMSDQPKFNGGNRSGNNELSFGFGNKHTISKHRQEEDSEVGLLNLFGNEKIFGFDNNLTKASAGTTEVHKLDEGRSTNEQACNVGNSYRVYTGIVQQESRLENSENARNNEFMTAFSNHGRSGVDVMAELFWRADEENILLSGLADTSSRLLQPSGSFPAFGTMSDKGESELFSIGEKYDSISGFEGLRSGSIEHMEYDFLTTQTSSHSEVPKGLSYDTEMSQGFDSSGWLEKEALPLLPKIGSRYQVATVCAWCRNEFHHEPVDTGAETGSVGFMCPTCKAKFSGNHSAM